MSLLEWGWLCQSVPAALRLAAETLAFWRWRKAMADTATPIVYLSTSQVAKRLQCEEWQIRRLFERHLLPEPPRMAKRRIILESDLPKFREALAVWRSTK